MGYETARVLCKAGARVILACRNIKAAEAAADKIRFELEGEAARSAHRLAAQRFAATDISERLLVFGLTAWRPR